MDKTIILNKLYPTLVFGVDYEVTDNGEGPILQWFNKEIPEPTQAELETAWLEVEKEIQAKQLSDQKGAKIISKLGATDTIDALIKQVNLMRVAIKEANIETPELKAVNDGIDEILNKGI